MTSQKMDASKDETIVIKPRSPVETAVSGEIPVGSMVHLVNTSTKDMLLDNGSAKQCTVADADGKWADNQTFVIEKAGADSNGSFYYIRNVGSNLYLNVLDAGTGDGAVVQMWKFQSDSSSQWYIEDGSFIVNVNSKKTMQVKTAPGVTQGYANKDTYQRWAIVRKEEIKEVTMEYSADQSMFKNPQPDFFEEQTYTNATTLDQPRNTFTVTRSREDSMMWHQSHEAQLRIGMEMGFGLVEKLFMKYKVYGYVQYTGMWGKDHGWVKKTSETKNISVAVPKCSTVVVSVSALKYTADIPYTGTVEYTSGRKETHSGTFKATWVGDLAVDMKQTKLDNMPPDVNTNPGTILILENNTGASLPLGGQ